MTDKVWILEVQSRPGAAAGESKYKTENGFRAGIEAAVRNSTPIVRASLPTGEVLSASEAQRRYYLPTAS